MRVCVSYICYKVYSDPSQDDPHRYTIKEELGTGATATVCRPITATRFPAE